MQSQDTDALANKGVYEVGVYLMSERFEWRERLNKTLFRDSR